MQFKIPSLVNQRWKLLQEGALLV
ncbi:hypothetical protein Gotur_021938 [Gossypium turneri]